MRVTSGPPETWPSSRTCTACDEEKPLDAFYRQPKGLYGRQSICKVCDGARARRWHSANAAKERARSFMRHYGISVEEYDRLRSGQGDLCAICRRPERRSRNGKAMMLAVDHDHVSGQVRGLLCHGCNSAIGHLSDDPVIIEEAAAYVRRFQ